jgi:hypothetical protein
MFDEKRQYPFSMKHEEKRIGANASEQDIQIDASTVQAPMHQVNAIELTIKRDNNSNTTTVSTGTTTDNNFSLMRDEETDITTRITNTGDVLYNSVLLSIDKARRKSSEKAKEFVTRDANPAVIEAKKDAQDIAALGESVEGLARTFENLMTEIRKKPYSEQVRLLTGYKKLLKEQINVIDSRINMAKRLK